jgi:hypothetical protein
MSSGPLDRAGDGTRPYVSMANSRLENHNPHTKSRQFFADGFMLRPKG